MILCKEHRSVRKKQAATPSKVTACFVLLLILFRKVGHNAVGSDISFAHRLGKLIGTTGAVPGGKTAGLVGSHLPINSDIGAVQFQTAQQGAGATALRRTKTPSKFRIVPSVRVTPVTASCPQMDFSFPGFTVMFSRMISQSE